jgi:ribosomal protein S27AE
MVVLWAMISFADIFLALVFSLLGFAITHVLIGEDVLKLKRGKFEFLLIPFGSILLMCGVLLMPLWIGTILILNSTLLLILLFVLFVKRYPSSSTRKRIRSAIFGSIKRRSNTVVETPKVETTKVEPSKPKAEKKYCPHCGSSVEMDFGFCPRCGMDVSLLESCSKCGTLRKVSKDTLFCPNCGMQKEKNTTRPPPPKKWLSINGKKEQGFEKIS